MWKNTTEMEETVQRAGVDVKRTGWKCNACDNVFWNRNKSRMIQHLTGDASRCSGIEPCTKADAALRKLAVASLNLDEDKKDLTKKRSAEREGIADAEDADRAGLVQQKLKHKTVAVCEVEGALSDMFDGIGFGHSVVDHILFHRFVQAARNAPPDWKLPCRVTLGGSILDAQYHAARTSNGRAPSCSFIASSRHPDDRRDVCSTA